MIKGSNFGHLFMVKRFGTDRHPGFEPAFMYVYM